MSPCRPLAGDLVIHPLRMVREQRGLTLAQVAKAMRTDVPSLSKLETGQELVGDEYLRRYSKALGTRFRAVRLAYLLTVQLAAMRTLEWAHREIEAEYPKKG